MPTFALTGTGSAHLPRGLITVTLETETTSLTADLEVYPEEAAVRPRVGVAVIPVLTEKVRFVARPRSTDSFPIGTMLHLTITVDERPESHRLLVSTSRAAGLETCELATVEPAGERIKVFREEPRDEEPLLSPLGEAATTEARRLIGRRNVKGELAPQIHIAVDGSASMASLSGLGSVAALTDIIAGLASVAARDLRVSSLRISGRSGELPSVPKAGDGPGAELERALFEGELTSGSPSLPGILAEAGSSVCYYLTDTVPLAQTDPLSRASVHLVVLAGQGAARILADQTTFACTFVPPQRRDQSMAQSMLENTELLRATVGALAAPISVAATQEDRYP
jgi:hypothetical protein